MLEKLRDFLAHMEDIIEMVERYSPRADDYESVDDYADLVDSVEGATDELIVALSTFLERLEPGEEDLD